MPLIKTDTFACSTTAPAAKSTQWRSSCISLTRLAEAAWTSGAVPPPPHNAAPPVPVAALEQLPGKREQRGGGLGGHTRCAWNLGVPPDTLSAPCACSNFGSLLHTAEMQQVRQMRTLQNVSVRGPRKHTKRVPDAASGGGGRTCTFGAALYKGKGHGMACLACARSAQRDEHLA